LGFYRGLMGGGKEIGIKEGEDAMVGANVKLGERMKVSSLASLRRTVGDLVGKLWKKA